MNSGYDRLLKAVMSDCNEPARKGGRGCFNPDGCDKNNDHDGAPWPRQRGERCFHAYCDKFVWILNRAKHYAEKTGLDWETILDAWEAKRDYWYMNYYQECNFPEINADRVRVFETEEELQSSLGDKKLFRCPACGGVSTLPRQCNASDRCGWNVGGLFSDLGKGVFVFVKEKVMGERVFMPLAWEGHATKSQGGAE